ncbi:MAG: cbb3-type cytochrome oxidase assembly protein CcoS [Planctomycetota bacterium]
MDVVIILVFVSLLLVCGAILLLVWGMRQGDFDHADRLSLLPLTDDRLETRSLTRDAAQPLAQEQPGRSTA